MKGDTSLIFGSLLPFLNSGKKDYLCRSFNGGITGVNNLFFRGGDV